MSENEIYLHEYRSETYSGAMMIVGFPSIGLVSSIAANFIIRTSKLERVAGLMSNSFPPYAFIHKGVPSPPVRIYAGERQCKDGEQCQQVVTVAAEFMPKPEQVRPLAERLLDYCSEKGIETIVALEGINWPGNEEMEIFGAGSTNESREMLKKYGVEELKEGMVSGISGVLLFEGEVRGINVICLLGPARPNFPDARGLLNSWRSLRKCFRRSRSIRAALQGGGGDREPDPYSHGER